MSNDTVTPTSEPTTWAGRALLDSWRKDRHLTAEQAEHVKTVVRGIEDEARLTNSAQPASTQEVERLRAKIDEIEEWFHNTGIRPSGKELEAWDWVATNFAKEMRAALEARTPR